MNSEHPWKCGKQNKQTKLPRHSMDLILRLNESAPPERTGSLARVTTVLFVPSTPLPLFLADGQLVSSEPKLPTSSRPSRPSGLGMAVVWFAIWTGDIGPEEARFS